ITAASPRNRQENLQSMPASTEGPIGSRSKADLAARRTSRPPGWPRQQQPARPARLAAEQPAWGMSTTGRSSNLLWIFARAGTKRKSPGTSEHGHFIPEQKSTRGYFGSQDPEQIIVDAFSKYCLAATRRAWHVSAGRPGHVNSAKCPGSRSSS